MKEKRKLLMELFTSTLYLSAFTFGGGYVIVSLLKERFVDQLHYIDEKEMLDLVAIAQSAPGAIAVNGAIVLGYKMAGILGIIVCVIGTIIPPIVIISVIAYFYKIFITNKIISAMLLGMRAGIGAIIVSVVYDMALSVMDEHQGRNILIMIVSFVLNYFFNINIFYFRTHIMRRALVYKFTSIPSTRLPLAWQTPWSVITLTIAISLFSVLNLPFSLVNFTITLSPCFSALKVCWL